MFSKLRSAGWMVVVAIVVLATFPTPLWATWSVIAVDARSGRVVVASATCVSQGRFEGFPAKGLMDIQAIVVPGVGVAAAQAGVDNTRANQTLIYQELKRGTHPEQILEQLRQDPAIERRQFGILNLQGQSAGFSGGRNGAASLSTQGSVAGGNIHYSIQGNILESDDVVHDAVEAFEAEDGSITDRVMAAMVAADLAGGDSRCHCAREPTTDAPCEFRTAFVAYLLAADPDDREGESFNDGDYAVYLNVTDENIRPNENANPVITLRRRYDRWKREEGPG